MPNDCSADCDSVIGTNIVLKAKMMMSSIECDCSPPLSLIYSIFCVLTFVSVHQKAVTLAHQPAHITIEMMSTKCSVVNSKTPMYD